MIYELDSQQTQMNRFAAELRSAGEKMTPQRWEVYREVALAGSHPDAEQIFQGVRQRLPAISLDTVYRTLWLLQDLGLLATLGSPRESVRFDSNLHPHHHFICTRCGLAEDVFSPEFDRLAIPDHIRSLGKLEKARVEIRGICNRCSSPAEQPQDPIRSQGT